MTERNQALQRELPTAYWLGGSPCAGKSTVADLLGEMFNLRVFHVDETADERWGTITEAGQPVMWRLLHYDCDQLWMRDATEQVRGAIAFYREEFSLIVDEIRSLPRDAPLLIEGASLLPDAVAPYLGEPQRAAWLVPTEAFQRRQYAMRPWIHDVLASCSDKGRAFDLWMDRDARFAQWVREQADARRYAVLVNDGGRSIEAVAEEVALLLGLR